MTPVSSARGRFPTSRGPSFLLRLSEGLPGLLAALLWRRVIFKGDARGPFLGVPKATLLIFSLERDRFPREAPAGELPPETGLAGPDTPGAEGRAACAVLASWGQAPCVAPAMQVRGPHDSAAPQAASAHLDEPRLSLPGTLAHGRRCLSGSRAGSGPIATCPFAFLLPNARCFCPPLPVSVQTSLPLGHEASGGSESRGGFNPYLGPGRKPP